MARPRAAPRIAPTKATPRAGRRWQAVLEGPQVVLVDDHGLHIARGLEPGLLLEAGPLLVGVGELAEGVPQLPAGDDGLEAFHVPGLVPVGTREGRDLLGVV